MVSFGETEVAIWSNLMARIASRIAAISNERTEAYIGNFEMIVHDRGRGGGGYLCCHFSIIGS